MPVASMYIASSTQIASGVLPVGSSVEVSYEKIDAVRTGTWTWGYVASVPYCMEVQSSDTDGNECDITVSLPAGTYTMHVLDSMHDTNQGILEVYMDSVLWDSIDQYNGSTSVGVVTTTTGLSLATSGTHTVTLKCNGKNGSSSNHYIRTSKLIFLRTA